MRDVIQCERSSSISAKGIKKEKRKTQGKTRADRNAHLSYWDSRDLL